ncbi:MAG: hypothetical protein K0U10_03915, partial [Gammaproteobacteria bacterium]|nr:hypothetical protein [Gammaproteobacteria bacterium]
LNALKQESLTLENVREQQESDKRFYAHYDILEKNKELIEKLDTKIATLLEKKLGLIKSYSEMVERESRFMIQNLYPFSEKKTPSVLCQEFHKSFQSYETELTSLQTHRTSLWSTHKNFQQHLLTEEKERNKKLDALYARHTTVLEKIYLSHLESTDTIDKVSIEAGKQSFAQSILYPLQFLTSFFNGDNKSSAIKKTISEVRLRKLIDKTETEINNSPNHDDHMLDSDEGRSLAGAL